MSDTVTKSRREEDREQRRQELLDAAEIVFAERGVEAATFGQVAKAARWSRPLVYVYFPTKEDLVYALTERALVELHRRFLAAANGPGPGLEQTMAIGRAYHRFALEHPLYYELLMHMNIQEATAGAYSPAEEACLQCGKQVIGLIAETLVRGLGDGSVRPGIGDPGLTAISLWAYTHGLIQLGKQKERVLEREHGIGVDALMEHGFRLMRGALRGPQAPE